jgi:hypothetical protein
MCFVGQPAEGVGLTGSAGVEQQRESAKSKPAPFPKTERGAAPELAPHLSLGHLPKSRGKLFWIGPAATPFSSVDTCRLAP